MTYTRGRPIHDADSHLMESADWLQQFVSPQFRSRTPRLDLHGLEADAEHALAEHRSRVTPVPLTLDGLLELKNWHTPCGFDPSARRAALDLFGFRTQLVFSTYSHLPLVNHGGESPHFDLDLLYHFADAHNRGIAEFCRSDSRLLPVGFVPTDDPSRAFTSAERALEWGCVGIEIPSHPSGNVSITHPMYHALYEMLQKQGAPLLFHVGGGGQLVCPTFSKNGGPSRSHNSEHESPMPSLTYIGIPAPLEMAIAALIVDGIFEKFPLLKCGVIEQGAAWVPGFLRRLDVSFTQFAPQKQRGRLTMLPSEYFYRQVRVTPFPFEDIGWLVEQTGPMLYMFGSDFPHDEGGTQPLELFDGALSDYPASFTDAIYWRNFEDLMGPRLDEALRVVDDKSENIETPDESRWKPLHGTVEPIAVHRKKLLLRKLINDYAARTGLFATEPEIQEAINDYRITCGLLSYDDAIEWMREAGISEGSLVKFARDGVLGEKVQNRLACEIEAELSEHLRLSTAKTWKLTKR